MNELLRILCLLFAHTRVETQALEHPEIEPYVMEAAEHYHVPQALLLSVGVTESALGASTHTRYYWGVMPPTMRSACAHDARCTGDGLHDQIEVSARTLARGRRICGTWEGAARFYQSGQCFMGARPRTRVRLRAYRRAAAYSGTVLGLARQIERRYRRENGSLGPIHAMDARVVLAR